MERPKTGRQAGSNCLLGGNLGGSFSSRTLLKVWMAEGCKHWVAFGFWSARWEKSSTNMATDTYGFNGLLIHDTNAHCPAVAREAAMLVV